MATDSIIDLAPPRGMRDFYPEQAALRDYLFEVWTSAARRHGFVRYDACVVENLALLTRKAGEEIVDQIYAFKDKSDRDLALRPEMTPSLARMVAARGSEYALPLKWFAIAQCFRYERTSRGRKREHYQWNLDIIGADGAAPEVEILATALEAVEHVGLAPSLCVHVSNRALLADLLAREGIPAERHAALFLALDKRGKLAEDALAGLLAEHGFNAAEVERVFALFNLDSLAAVRDFLGTATPACNHLAAVFDGLAAYGMADRAIFDLSVVRGLNYYTGTVFEAFDRQRRFRAVFGGGRYDGLLQQVGGKPTPAVGLGFGDVVIAEIMAELGCLPERPPAADLLIGYMAPDQAAAALQAARRFRGQGQRVDLAMQPEKARAFFTRANRNGARQAVYIGPDDVLSGRLRLKDLAARTETEISIEPLSETAS